MKSLEMEPKSAKRNIEVTSRQIPRLATNYHLSALILFLSLLHFLSAPHSVVGVTLGTLEMAAPNSAGKAFLSVRWFTSSTSFSK